MIIPPQLTNSLVSLVLNPNNVSIPDILNETQVTLYTDLSNYQVDLTIFQTLGQGLQGSFVYFFWVHTALLLTISFI